MVIFIGGATHTGKTLLAQNLMEETGYPYLSLDHLKMGLLRSGMLELTPESPDADITALVWPIAREMAKMAIENEQNLIIEGCYIPFDWRNDFEDGYHPKVNAVFLAMDKSYISD
ncbi:MAG: adenylate kinase, partial [Bifidobacteriaceae bacterium]|nr:adenylate kinase [Bifidobacteriaceae bacterium]